MKPDCHVFVLGIVGMLLLSVSGCAGDGPVGHAVGPSASEAPAASGFAGLPTPDALRKASGVESGVYRQGSDLQSEWPHRGTTRDNSGWCRIESAANDGSGAALPGFAMYAFNTSGLEHDDILRLEPGWSSVYWDHHLNTWIGLADWTRNTWDWHECPESWELALDPARHLADDALVVAVLSLDQVVLHSLRLHPDYPPRITWLEPTICVSGETVLLTPDWTEYLDGVRYGQPEQWHWKISTASEAWEYDTRQVEFTFTDVSGYVIEIVATNAVGLYRMTSPFVVEEPGLYHPAYLYAIPDETEVGVSEPVTVRVLTGRLPPNQPLAYMAGVGVKVEVEADYVLGSFNVGTVGGKRTELDGFWGLLDPVPQGIMDVDDWMLYKEYVGDSGYACWSFNITPVGGGESCQSAELFNFQLKFASPGEYHLSFFRDIDGRYRTYYYDADNLLRDMFWYDISNEGVPNTITVTE